MTKADLIDAIAASAGSSKKDAERALQVSSARSPRSSLRVRRFL